MGKDEKNVLSACGCNHIWPGIFLESTNEHHTTYRCRDKFQKLLKKREPWYNSCKSIDLSKTRRSPYNQWPSTARFTAARKVMTCICQWVLAFLKWDNSADHNTSSSFSEKIFPHLSMRVPPELYQQQIIFRYPHPSQTRLQFWDSSAMRENGKKPHFDFEGALVGLTTLIFEPNAEIQRLCREGIKHQFAISSNWKTSLIRNKLVV